VEGAYSQQAAEKLFKAPNLMYFKTFEGVFAAIKQGLCDYGVLPLENSTAGSVNAIYDLMMKYDFSIVRSTRVKIDHCVLANRGAALDGVREIFSHEQALAQCGEFLKTLGNVKVTACENTAEAARLVFESGRKDAAALSSRACAAIYGLDCLRSPSRTGQHYTRFICISRRLGSIPVRTRRAS
jgi:chorismate mutase/prephenate dehydratase